MPPTRATLPVPGPFAGALTGDPAARAANDAGLDPRFARVAAQAAEAERRALDAIARLAEPIARLSEALDARLAQADRRNLGELTEIRADLQELEQAVMRRLQALEAGQSQAVAGLREEVFQALARLTERVERAQRGAAEAIAGLGRRLDALGVEAAAGDARLARTLDLRLTEGRTRTERLIGGIRADLARHDRALAEMAAQAQHRARLTNWTTTALLALAGVAAAVGLAAAGLQWREARAPVPTPVAVRLPLPLSLRPTLPANLGPANLGPAELGRAPGPFRARAPPAPPVPGSPRSPAAAVRAEAYSALAQAIARADPAALARVQALAQGGARRAQLLLARLYEAGEGGLPRDLALAREWTARAAAAGEPAAMHNLAIYMVSGQGGPADAPGAARWFARAAAAGVVDAQYNLGLLYENGRGVPKNLVEAYRWFSIAADAGDGLARGKAVALEARLTRTERAAAARSVRAFQPGRPAEGSGLPVIAPAATAAETQKLLAREGYFIGATDGADSEAYRAAVQAYLRDHPEAAAPTLGS